jgi:hypothetical protein
MTKNSGEDSKLITVPNRFRARLSVVRVDAIGVGHISPSICAIIASASTWLTLPCSARVNDTGA